jgi:hypothetical protein
MLIVAMVTTITSMLGMPWMVAATVRSLAHLRSLKEYGPGTPVVAEKEETVETQSSVEEEAAPALEMTGVVEQRVTGS